MERCCEAGGSICYSCPAGDHWFYDGWGGYGLVGYHPVQTVEDCPVCQEEGSV